jgi:sugar phosphate isomerase/epimerase
VKERVVRTSQAGLTVACLDTSCRFVAASEQERAQVVQEAREMVALAVEIGAPCLRVFGGPLPPHLTLSAILAPTADALGLAAEYASSHGVTLVLETHDAWSSSRDALALIQAARHPGLALLWDTWHTYRVGETPQQTLQNLGGSQPIGHVHVKDARREGDDWRLTLLEQGELPIQEDLRALHDAGYTGYISLEWEKKWHPEIEEPEVALPHFATLLRAYLAAL